jgi:hypothetical protein
VRINRTPKAWLEKSNGDWEKKNRAAGGLSQLFAIAAKHSSIISHCKKSTNQQLKKLTFSF